MKKKLLCFVSVLILCLTAVCAVGCGKKGGSQSTVLLSGFESYDELLSMNWQNMFGKADLVTDDEYVTEGNYAAKLTVSGDYTAGAAARPTMTIYTDTAWLNKQDYTDTTGMSVDVYNAQSTALNMYFQFAILNDQNTLQYSSEQKIVLQPGANAVEIAFDRGFLNQLIDIKNITRLLFAFDNATEKNQPDRVLYMDNFVAHTTAEAIPTDVKIREQDELESADRAEYLSAWGIINYIYSPSELTHNTDPQYVSQGTGSFKFTAPATGGGSTTPGFIMRSTPISDISSYYSISFDIYNDNDEDYQFITFAFKPIGVAKANAWTRFEFTIEQLKDFKDEDMMNLPGFNEETDHYKYDIYDFKNFNLITTNNSKDEPITFYFDNFFANKSDQSKPLISIEDEYSSEVNLGDTYTVPQPTVEKGELDKWQIFDPSGNQVGADNAAGFTAEVKGTYTIVYTASNSNGASELRLEIYSGTPPTITLDDYNVIVSAGTFTVPEPQVANEGVLSWKIYRMTDGVRSQVGSDNDAQFNADGGFFQIEYTAVNSDSSRTACLNILVIGADSYTRLEAAYPELYSADNIKATLGSASVSNRKAYLLGDSKAYRLYGDGTAASEITFNTDIGTAQNFGFAIFNPGDTDLTFTFGKATTYSLKANSWLRFDLPVSWYGDWGCVNNETNVLEKVSFSVSGSGQIEAYIGFFTLSPKQSGPSITVGQYEEHSVELTEFTVPDAQASGGAAVSHEVYKKAGDGWTKYADNVASFTPDEPGEYKIVYYASNVYGETTREISVLFGAVPEIILDGADDLRIDAGVYYIETPSLNNATEVSWTVYRIFSNLLYGDKLRMVVAENSPESFTADAGYTYEIVYTSANSVATVVKSQRLAVESGTRLEQAQPDGFVSDSITASGGQADIGGGITGKAIHVTGTQKADVIFAPDIYLSAGLSSMPFWIYNAGDGAVNMTVAGSKAWSTPYVIEPGIWYRVDLPVTEYLKVWGVVTSDNMFDTLSLSFDGATIDIYADLLTVHTDDAVAFNVPSDITAETDVNTEYIVPAVTAVDGSAVSWKVLSPEGTVFADGSPETFTPTSGGVYTIEYSATNPYGTSTYELEVTSIANVPVFNEYEKFVFVNTGSAGAANYTITAPTTKDGESVTWKVYQVACDIRFADGAETLIKDNSPVNFDVISAVSYRIEYSATNEDGTTKVNQYVVGEGGNHLDTLYEELYTAEYIEINNGKAEISGGMSGKAIHAYGEGKVEFIFKPDMYLGGALTSLPFWIYNAGGSAVSVTLADNGVLASVGGGVWWRVNFPVESPNTWLQSWGVIGADNTLDAFKITVTGEGQIDVYIDLITVYTNTALAFNVPSDITAETDVNTEYTVPAVTAVDGSAVSWKVLSPEGTVFADDSPETFTPTSGGVYTIVYSATNPYGTSTYELEVTSIANVPVFNEYEKFVFVNTGSAGAANYTITAPTTKDGESVTWKVYQCNNNLQWGDGTYSLLKENSPVNFDVVVAVSYRIEYSATNEDGTATAVQYIVGEGGYRLEEIHGEAFIDDNLTASAGTATIEAAGITDKTIHITGSDSAAATFAPNVYMSAGLTDISLWVYNDSAQDVSAIIGKAVAYTIKPGVWYRVSYPLGNYRDWQYITEDNRFVNFEVSFSSDGEISVYVDLFTVFSTAAFDFEVPDNIVTEADLNEPYTVPAVTATDGSAVSWKVLSPEGTVFADGSPETFTPTSGGVYTIVYSATNAFGTEEYEINVTAVANTPILTLDEEHVFIDTGAAGAINYTITPPSVNDGSAVTWKVYQLDKSTGAETLVKDNSPVNFDAVIAVSYKIEYSATNEDGTTVVVQYVACEGGYRLEELYAEAFSADNLTSSAGTAAIEPVGLTEKTIHVNGNGSAAFSFKPDIYLSSGATGFSFWAFNAGENNVTMSYSISGANITLYPGIWTRVSDYPLDWHKAWGAIDADNNLVNFSVSVNGEGAIDVYFDLLTVSSNAALTFNVPSDITAETDVNTEYIVPAVTATDGSAVSWKVLSPEGTVFADGSPETFTPTSGGVYIIVYSATNAFGTETYTVSVTVIVPGLPEIVLENTHIRAEAGTYAIPAPEAGDGTLTWKVYKSNNNLLYGDRVRTEVTEYGDNPASIDLAGGWSYEIVYTLTNAAGSTTETLYVICESSANALETAHPEIFDTQYMNSDAGSKIEIAAAGECITDYGIKVSGEGQAKLDFAPMLQLEGTESELTFWMYIEAEADTVQIVIGGNSPSSYYINAGMPAGVWYRVQLPMSSHAKPFGMVSAENVLEKVTVNISGSGPITVYVDSFIVV